MTTTNTTHAPDTAPRTTSLSTPLTNPPALVASDIDGTLLVTGRPASVEILNAVAAVCDVGHHFVLATGRSLSGALTAARELGLTDGWLIASNGAVTARLVGGSYALLEARDVDAEAAIRLATRIRPDVRIAVEIVGIGYHVSEPFPARELNGDQVKVNRLSDLWVGPTPRVVVYGQDAQRLVPALRAAGLTAIATRVDWVDVTVGGASKATAVEHLRQDLGIPIERTIAIGDGENDIELLQWAWRGVAMGHATAQVRDAADEVTGTIGEMGAVRALRSLLSKTRHDGPIGQRREPQPAEG